jgi:ethanolamine utilization cobalamin adenosyltransferase
MLLILQTGLRKQNKMSKYLTEQELRDSFSLSWGTEIHLPGDTRLTPSAAQLLSERKINIKYIDEQGRVFIKKDPDSGKLKQVHPLTSSEKNHNEVFCSLCNNKIDKKSDLLTWLDSENLVPKNHPRIFLRGKLDTVISYFVLLQNEFESYEGPAIIKTCLSDLRSYAGNILRAEVKNEDPGPLQMCSLDSGIIHKMSHNPFKYMNHDHIVPDMVYGKWVSRLNYLRALVREAELLAVNTFTEPSLHVSRPSLINALNRLSSALYVLMILLVISGKGIKIDTLVNCGSHEAVK